MVSVGISNPTAFNAGVKMPTIVAMDFLDLNKSLMTRYSVVIRSTLAAKASVRAACWSIFWSSRAKVWPT